MLVLLGNGDDAQETCGKDRERQDGVQFFHREFLGC
jgi:hypothetical protein